MPSAASSQPTTSIHTTPPDEAAQVLRQFRVVFNAVRHHFLQVEKQVGIGGAQVWALSTIAGQPGIGVTDLARAMDIHQSTASNLVRQLVKKGLARTEKSALDKRNVHLHVEAAGAELLKRAPGPHVGVLPAALQKMPSDSLGQLHAQLGLLIKALAVDEQAGLTPLASL